MVERAPFKVIREIDGIEIRRYDKMILATVKGLSDNGAFSYLFDYITGTNSSRRKIPMTAPVISTPEKIPMTVPVISDEKSFSFVMPSMYTMDTIPLPKDPRVELQQLPERTVAVMTFRGRAGETDVERRTGELVGVLKKNSINQKDAVFLMRYNPPFTPGFMRTNEVGVEIEG